MTSSSSPSTDDHEHQRLRNALRESELLREIAALLTSSLDLAHILHTLAQRTTEVCEVERCAVWLCDEERRAFTPAAYHLSTTRLAPEAIARGDNAWHKSSIHLDTPAIHRLLSSADGTLMLENLYEEVGMRDISSSFLVRSILLILLVHHGRTVGMMSIDNPDEPTHFSSTQQQLACALAQQATIAITNAQLYQQAQTERKRANALIERAQSIYQVAKAVNSGTNLQTVLWIALDHLIYQLMADGGSVVLFQDNTFSLVTTTLPDTAFIASDLHVPTLTDLPNCSRAANEKTPFFVPFEQTTGLERRWYQQLGLQNVILVPLLLGPEEITPHSSTGTLQDTTRCIGFIFVTYEQPTHSPSQEELAFAQDIATQCALAIEKDRILAEAHHAADLATEQANTLNAVFSAMTEGITVLNLDGQVLINNNTASQFLGVPMRAQEHLTSFLNRFPTYTLQGQPISVEDFPVSRALRGETIRGERFITHRIDGSERVVEINVSPLLDSASRKTGLVCAFRDVTEQVRIERRIRRALDAMLHAVEAVSGVIDQNTIMHNVLAMALNTLNGNYGTLQLFDEQRKVFLPQLSMRFAATHHINWFDEQTYWPVQHNEQTLQFHARLREGRALLVTQKDCLYHLPAEQQVYDPQSLILATPLIHNDHLLGIITLDRFSFTDNETHRHKRDFTVWDLTLAEGIAQIAALALDELRWKQEAELARLKEAEMRASNELKDEFIDTTAHEFRNPITVILAHSQLMSRLMRRSKDTTLRDNLQESAVAIEGQAHQLENIVNRFQEVTRLNKGQLTLDVHPIDIAELLKRVIAMHSPTAPNNPISHIIAPSLHPYIIEGDEVRLTQVFGNLLQNAIKYSLPGGPITVSLKIQDEAKGHAYIEGCIADQGIGIPPEAQVHLFERFYRAANAKSSKKSGMGLGLYIVAQLLHLHKGSIRVESSGIRGEGSRFIFTLPLAKDAQGEL